MWYLVLIFIVLIIVAVLIVYFLVIAPANKKNHNKYPYQPDSNISVTKNVNENLYRIRNSLMTANEKKYFECIKSFLPNEFIVLPQVNLATVLEKISGTYYQNELYRNVDFGVFDLNYKPLLLIEINDESHKQSSRVARDKKVADICFSAGLPLLRFWTSYGVNRDYMIKRFRQYLDFSVSD